MDPLLADLLSLLELERLEERIFRGQSRDIGHAERSGFGRQPHWKVGAGPHREPRPGRRRGGVRAAVGRRDLGRTRHGCAGALR